jgi:hypothetical protein
LTLGTPQKVESSPGTLKKERAAAGRGTHTARLSRDLDVHQIATILEGQEKSKEPREQSKSKRNMFGGKDAQLSARNSTKAKSLTGQKRRQHLAKP